MSSIGTRWNTSDFRNSQQWGYIPDNKRTKLAFPKSRATSNALVSLTLASGSAEQ